MCGLMIHDGLLNRLDNTENSRLIAAGYGFSLAILKFRKSSVQHKTHLHFRYLNFVDL